MRAIFNVHDQGPLLDEATDMLEIRAYISLLEFCSRSNSTMIIIEELTKAALADENYQLLTATITRGFPSNASGLPPSLPQYWNVRDWLSTSGGLVLMGDHIVIPKQHRATPTQQPSHRYIP